MFADLRAPAVEAAAIAGAAGCVGAIVGGDAAVVESAAGCVGARRPGAAGCVDARAMAAMRSARASSAKPMAVVRWPSVQGAG
jgi:hypothetical protein